MVNKPIFTGAATALITPTTPAGVDYEALGRLIDWQIAQGIDALVIAGSTGEGKTLSIAEHKEVLRYSAERIAGRVPMVAGTGSNELSVSIDMSRYACSVGADGLLVVTPYYIKATQNGLVQMYTMIADAVTKPLILYNVPSRTGVNIEPQHRAGDLCPPGRPPEHRRHQGGQQRHLQDRHHRPARGGPAGPLLRQRRPDDPDPFTGRQGRHQRPQ